jgi:hypothetical protein
MILKLNGRGTLEAEQGKKREYKKVLKNSQRPKHKGVYG